MKKFKIIKNHTKSFEVALKSQKSVGNHIKSQKITENHMKSFEVVLKRQKKHRKS